MAASKSNPIPDIPECTEIPLFKTTTKRAGTTKIPTSTTFYYAGIQSIWLWWLVDLEVLKKRIRRYKMTPYEFEPGKGAVNINFFNAAAMYGMGQPGNMGIGGFNETEVNVVAYASKVARNVPKGITLDEYLANGEPTKRVGNMRLWVACDDAVAVAAGRQVFDEFKFLTPYTYAVPAFNNGSQPTYDWTCHDPKIPPPNQPPGPECPSQSPPPKQVPDPNCIYRAKVNLEGLTPTPTPGNFSELIDLSYNKKSRRPVGSRRNYFGLFNTYPLPRGSKAVKITVGKSTDPSGRQMANDIKKLTRTKPQFIQTYISPPCIAEAAGYFADV